MAAPRTVDENQTYLPDWILSERLCWARGRRMVLGYWRNIKSFIANGWPAATVVTLWSFKVEEQSYVSIPLLVWVRAPKTLMILLASVAGA